MPYSSYNEFFFGDYAFCGVDREGPGSKDRNSFSGHEVAKVEEMCFKD